VLEKSVKAANRILGGRRTRRKKKLVGATTPRLSGEKTPPIFPPGLQRGKQTAVEVNLGRRRTARKKVQKKLKRKRAKKKPELDTSNQSPLLGKRTPWEKPQPRAIKYKSAVSPKELSRPKTFKPQRGRTFDFLLGANKTPHRKSKQLCSGKGGLKKI